MDNKTFETLTNAQFELEKALVVANDQASAFDDKPPFMRTDEWLEACAWRNGIVIEKITAASDNLIAALDTLLSKAEIDKEAI